MDEGGMSWPERRRQRLRRPRRHHRGKDHPQQWIDRDRRHRQERDMDEDRLYQRTPRHTAELRCSRTWMTVANKTIRNSTNAIAEAKPMRQKRKPSTYMYMTRLYVR